MSRVVVHRSLPSLETLLGPFSDFASGRSHQQHIIEELRAVAQKLKSVKSQPFYSMREVAQFFNVPLGTITRVYKVLEREGIINRIRSSHTMLVGQEVSRRDAIRGLVGIYIWLHSIVLMPYTQTLVMEFEEQLRRSGYVADIIFHSGTDEETRPEFAQRLLQHHLDVVVLHTPVPGTRQNIFSLRERGVRVIIVQRKDLQSELPALIYLQDYKPGYQKMAVRWRELGIRQVLFCTPIQYLHSKSEPEFLKSILNEHGLEVESVQIDAGQLLQKIRQRKSKIAPVVAFLDGPHCEQFCNTEPQIVEQISKVSRLAFCTGAIRIPYLRSRKVRADLVDFSPLEIAAKLAEDIGQLSVLPDGFRHTFVAKYQEQVPI